MQLKEYPILFSGDMMRAILDKRKTQTRRVIKPQPPLVPMDRHAIETVLPPQCPYGQPGDLLWVRETWRLMPFSIIPDVNAKVGVYIEYRSDIQMRFVSSLKMEQVLPMWKKHGTKWRPSIHMPCWASRIILRITGVRVERVQDISLYDAVKEGYPDYAFSVPEKSRRHALISKEFNTLLPQVRKWFVELWDSIYAKRGYGWDINPWVWVIDFEVYDG